jgi:hypothetical protein
MEFTEFEKFETPAGMLVIPTKSATKSWEKGEKLLNEEQTEVKLLSVNKPLDPSMFTLAADATKVVLSSDVTPETRMRYEPHNSQVSWTAESIVWALGLLAVLALLALGWRKAQKHQSAVIEHAATPPSGVKRLGRHWLQFSLSGLMVMVLLAATVVGLARSLQKRVVFDGLPDSSHTPIDHTAFQYEWDQSGRRFLRVMRRNRPKSVPYSETWFKPVQDGKPNVEKRILYYSNRQKAIEEQPSNQYQCWLPNGSATSWKEANAMLQRDNGDGAFAALKSQAKSDSK